jgi:hypothetical protein
MAPQKLAPVAAAETAPVSTASASVDAPTMDKHALRAHHAMVRRQTRPWWAVLIPDMRGAAGIGCFGLTLYMLYMIGQDHSLLKSVPFMQFASALTAGGFLLVCSFLFGANKASTDAAKPPPT